MKLPLVYLTICCAASHAAYLRHMVMNKISQHRPMAFRPGVIMRPWSTRGPIPAASSRTPFVVYRNIPHNRFAMKPYIPQGAVFKNGQLPWKATRSPLATSVTEHQFLRAVSAQPSHIVQANGAKGAIHTIPAPNLSLSEKPIVVIESDNINTVTSSEAPKQTYEVTEKYPDQSIFQMAKIEQPIGFSKATSLTEPELQSLIRNGAALQLASELGLSAISLPHNPFITSLSSPPSNHQQFFSQHIVPQQQILHQQQIAQHQNEPQHQIAPQPQVQQQQNVQQHQFVSQQQTPEQHILPQQFVSHQSIVPQAFTLPGLNQQDFLHANSEGLFISPNALYQPDPSFMQKLTDHILQRFPGVEFIPYTTEVHMQAHNGEAPHHMQAQASVNHPQFIQKQPETQSQVQVLENEQVTKQTPSSFVASDTNSQKTVTQRKTQEGTLVTITPQIVANVTENQVEVTSPAQLQNITIELVPAETRSSTTTVKYVVESSTEPQKVTPIFYAQIGQSVENAEANGFFTSINDVRAAALSQTEKPQENQQTAEPLENVTNNTTITTMNPDLKAYFVQKQETDEKNHTVSELKPLLGVPFAKANDSVNVAYTLHRSDDKDAKVNKDGSVYAGQIVEATITEDHDFNKEKATLLSRRAPIRLFTATENKEAPTTTTTPQKVTVVKAKIPPRSKLTLDDKTGEPVLRIYASYIDSPMQKELLASKLTSPKRVREVSRKQDNTESWKSAAVNAAEKTQGHDGNQVTQFGLKLRSRSDDYVPLFEDYEDA